MPKDYTTRASVDRSRAMSYSPQTNVTLMSCIGGRAGMYRADGSRRAWRLVMALLGALLCVVAVGACGDDDDEGGGAGAQEVKPATLKVGVIPIADVAPLYLGVKQGFFQEEKLTIEPVLAEGGAAIVPAVISGSDQIGFSNATSLVIASSKKLPVKIISQGDIGGTSEEDAPDGVIVRKGSSIREPKDLEGKTVSVNTLNNVGPLTISNALEKRGVDPKKVKFTEVPFPDALAALDAKRVDAIWVVEPFQTAATKAGHRVLFHPFEEAAPDFTVATYFTTQEYIEKNPEIVERFVRAINKSMEYAESHPDEVRDIVTTYTKIPAALAKEMVLPHWAPDLHEDTIQLTIDLAAKYGFITEKPTLDDLIHRAE
jgi:ABC-type nitrate/sulfonate/bicarbonate transport system substrate-binding protein